MKLSRLVVGAVALAFVPTAWCAAASSVATPDDGFEIVIRDFYGVEGYTYVYRLHPGALAVSVENDFGRPAKELCNVPVSAAQAGEWGRFLAAFPLDALASEYLDPSVDDGLQITFSVKRGANPPRVIRVANAFQADLAILCDRVVALVPAGCVHRPLKLPAK